MLGIYIQDNKPTQLGILIEWVRQASNYNMITEHSEAFLTAVCVGVYTNQDFNFRMISNLQPNLLIEEYMNAYKSTEYIMLVLNMAEAFIASELYQKLLKQYDNKTYDIPLNKLLIEEARSECLKWGKFGRDIGKISSLQTTQEYPLIFGGAQLMQTMKCKCEYDFASKFNFI